MEKLSKRFVVLLSLIAILSSLAFYKSSIDYFFISDDFFEINISKAENFRQYLNFFKFRSDIIAYRPISLQNYFFLSNKFFGLNPIGFRLVTFTFFFASAFLITKVVTIITKNFRVSLFTASLWLLSSIHFMALTWIAAAYNIIGTFFWLLTSYLFLIFVTHKKQLFYVLSLISFMITIGSFEFSITWPVILGFYYFYLLKNSIIKSLKIFSPFILSSIIYLILRIFLIKVPQITEYHITFNLDSAKALFWYILWSLNIPEEFKKQIIDNILIFNSRFLKDYFTLVISSFTSALLILILSAVIPIFKIIKVKISVNYRLLTFALFWFLVGIFPVLLLPNHTFSMYLTLSSIGIYLLLSYLLTRSKINAIFPLLILILWMFSSATTVRFYKVNSWMIEAQRFSKEFSFQAKKQFPILPSNSIVLYELSDQRHRQALLGSHAIQTIYNDPTLTIYYNKKELIRDLSRINKNSIYYYIPK